MKGRAGQLILFHTLSVGDLFMLKDEGKLYRKTSCMADGPADVFDIGIANAVKVSRSSACLKEYHFERTRPVIPIVGDQWHEAKLREAVDLLEDTYSYVSNGGLSIEEELDEFLDEVCPALGLERQPRDERGRYDPDGRVDWRRRVQP